MSAGKYNKKSRLLLRERIEWEKCGAQVANKGSKIHSLQIQMGKLLQHALDLFGGERAREN
jgi:hypothetical protein